MADVNDKVISVATGNSAQYIDTKGQLYSIYTVGSTTGSIAIATSGNVSYKIFETNDLSIKHFPYVYIENNVGNSLSGTSFSVMSPIYLNDKISVTCSGIASATSLIIRYIII